MLFRVVFVAALELRGIVGEENVAEDASSLEDFGSDKYSFHSGPPCVCIAM